MDPWRQPCRHFISEWLTDRICTKTLREWEIREEISVCVCVWLVRDSTCEIKCKMESEWEMEIMSLFLKCVCPFWTRHTSVKSLLWAHSSVLNPKQCPLSLHWFIYGNSNVFICTNVYSPFQSHNHQLCFYWQKPTNLALNHMQLRLLSDISDEMFDYRWHSISPFQPMRNFLCKIKSGLLYNIGLHHTLNQNLLMLLNMKLSWTINQNSSQICHVPP